MSKISLLEKWKILLEISISSYWFIILLIALCILGMTFFKTNKKTVERNKAIYIILSLLLVSLLIIIYHSSISKMFDYMMNHFFIAIYFPNLAIYFMAIVITNIIFWISVFHFRSSEGIKKVNTFMYIMMNYMQILILSEIEKKKLDIFSQSSIYSNKEVTALIELSSFLFIIWIIFLILYKIILIYVRKDYKPKIKKIIVPKPIKKLPENYEPISIPKQVQKKETLSKRKYQSTKELEELFTLEDYRQLLKILKQEKEKKSSKEKEALKEETESLIRQKKMMIEREQKEKEERKRQERIQLEQLRIEAIKKEEEIREKEKFTELEMLYRGIK